MCTSLTRLQLNLRQLWGLLRHARRQRGEPDTGRDITPRDMEDILAMLSGQRAGPTEMEESEEEEGDDDTEAAAQVRACEEALERAEQTKNQGNEHFRKGDWCGAPLFARQDF